MSASKLKSVELFTDGACRGNPGPGGWAALLRFGETEKVISGGESETTNNRMELQAVIEGLRALKSKCDVKIITDSQYVMKAFEEKWLEKWQSNGWKTAAKDPVKNKELWIELLEMTSKHVIKWQWVKGHSGHRENEIVDTRAREEAAKH